MNRMPLSLFLWIPSIALAGSINLNPLAGGDEVYVEQAENVSGTCGGAVVRVIGVMDANPETFSRDQDGTFVIIRRSKGPELVLKKELSDHNKLDCVVGAAGPNIVLATLCSGSQCGDNFSFTVINPRTLRITTPAGGVPIERLKPYL